MQIQTQFSIFLINKPGVLAGVADALSKAKVNIMALALMDLKRHQEAEGHFKRSIDLKGNVSRTHADYAELLHHMGRKEEAETEYRTALEIDPSNAIAIMNLGTLFRDTGRFSEATELYQKARDLPDLDEESRKQLEEMLI